MTSPLIMASDGIQVGVLDSKSCPNEALYRSLKETPKLDAVQKEELKKIMGERVEWGESYYADISACRDIQKQKDISRMLPEPNRTRFLSENLVEATCRSGIVKVLAASLVDEDIAHRNRAIKELFDAKKIPEAKAMISEISKFYPVPAIMERAAQIMVAPEISDGCFYHIFGPVWSWNTFTL